MTITFKWVAPEALTTAISTGLNSFADSYSAISSSINNESDLYTRINLEFGFDPYDNHLASAAAVLVWILASMDGTNYEVGTAGTPGTVPPRSPDALIPVPIQNNNYAGRVTIANLLIPPLAFKLLLLSTVGGTLASSNNTLKYRRHNEQGV